MRRFLKRIHQGNKGFTLVEMLIVVAIIGILAAVIMPRFVGVVGHAETQAAAAEEAMVQTAMDTMMAKESLSSLTAVTTATSAMGSFPDATYPLYPNYFRTATTTGTYTCDGTGLVTQASTGY